MTTPLAHNNEPQRRVIAAVDDHAVTREGLPHLFPDYDLHVFADVPTLLAARPDASVVLLDLDLAGASDDPVLQGAAGVKAVASAGYRALIYTNERRRRVLVECVAAGASGIVHKAEPIEVVIEAIEEVAAGHVVITTALSGLAELYARRGELPDLTTRQKEVLAARARGTQTQSIAERLHINRRTVEDHIRTINQKFATFVQDHSMADLERHLGLGEGDLLDWRTPAT